MFLKRGWTRSASVLACFAVCGLLLWVHFAVGGAWHLLRESRIWSADCLRSGALLQRLEPLVQDASVLELLHEVLMPEVLLLIGAGTLLRGLSRLVPLAQYLLAPALLAFGCGRLLWLGFRCSSVVHEVLSFDLEVQILGKWDHSCDQSITLKDAVVEGRVSDLLHFPQVSIQENGLAAFRRLVVEDRSLLCRLAQWLLLLLSALLQKVEVREPPLFNGVFLQEAQVFLLVHAAILVREGVELRRCSSVLVGEMERVETDEVSCQDA